MPEIYDKDYFENGIKTGKSGYENYRWLPDRIYKEIRAVINLLGINPGDTVLDFGAALGFWVKGFRHYNIQAYGCDTSEYALSHGDPEIKDYLFNKILDNDAFDFIVSRNTLEHIEETELEKILKKFHKTTDVVFFTVPLIDPQTKDYVFQMPDITHKIKWTNAEWVKFCEDCGWKVTSYKWIDGIHDNFKNYPNSMGFYVLRKE